MQLVVLAAGRGTRIEAQKLGHPKSMVPILPDKHYLAYQVEAFRRFDFSKKIMVTGFSHEKLQDYMNSQAPQEFVFVHNPQFHLGSVLSILAAKDHLTEDFYIFNADHYYSPTTYEKIFSAKKLLQVFCDYDRQLTQDDMKIYSQNRQHLTNMSKALNEYHAGYVGVSLITKSVISDYWSCLDSVLKTVGHSASVEAVMNYLCQKHLVHLTDISGSWWTEIDTPEDLELARAKIIKEMLV